MLEKNSGSVAERPDVTWALSFWVWTARAGDGFVCVVSVVVYFDYAPVGTCCGEESVWYPVLGDSPSPLSSIEIPGNAMSELSVLGAFAAVPDHGVVCEYACDGADGWIALADCFDCPCDVVVLPVCDFDP